MINSIDLRFTTSLVLSVALVAGMLFALPAAAKDNSKNDQTYKVTIENLSPTIITPPLVSFSENAISFFEVGQSASEALEYIAEGGDTSFLASDLVAYGADITASGAPILPGGTLELEVNGENKGFINLAAMLLPTNDAFVALQSVPVKKSKTVVVYSNAYDAGTEANSELAVDIPGPLTGGEGFNPERDDTDIIAPHTGLIGVGDVDAEMYNWSDPVIRVTIEAVK